MAIARSLLTHLQAHGSASAKRGWGKTRSILQRVLSAYVAGDAQHNINTVLIGLDLCCSQKYLHSSSKPSRLGNSTDLKLFEHRNVSGLTLKHVNLHTSRNVQSSDSDNSSSRSRSRSSTSPSNDKLGEKKIGNDSDSKVDSLLETWFYEVCQYGSLTANIPFNTVIKPLNPQDYPNMNKVIIQLHYNTPDSELPPSHQLSQITGLYDMNVTFDKDKANMNLRCDLIQGLDLPILCTLHIPLKFDLTVKSTSKKGVHVEKMESNVINVETESGNCNLQGIKCGSISVVSKSGNIISKSTLLGNTILYTSSSGGIFMEKIQGSSVTCKTEMGPISVKSLYTDSTTFKTVMGNIHLGQCHGQMHILGENSQVTIDSLEGDLDVALQSGSVNVLLSRHNRADIDINSGDIGLSFPEGASSDLNLNCPTLKLHKNVGAEFDETDMPHHREGFIGQRGVSQINARTLSGTISLRLLDWIETTRLAFKKEE